MVDAMITLFEATATVFTSNGMGNLPDAVSCVVVEERNGKYELELEYPVTGKRYEELQLRRIIVAKPNPYAQPQPFRIYAITKPMNGRVTVNAEHISYDLSGYPVSPFAADTAVNAFVNMKGASVVPCPFSFSTDKTTSANMTVLKPTSMRALLGGVSGSILDVYGGEYEFDRFSVKLHNHRGADRGVTIRYGKNLTDLEQEENCSSVYTGVYPFWYSEQDGLLELDEKTIRAEGTYNFTRIYPLDLSDQWQERPTKEQLRTKAVAYMSAHKIGVPKVSLKVSFVQLAQSEEYKDFAILETVHLCDTVRVEFSELNVSAVSKCISTTYNVLTNKYDQIELGDSRSNLASTISSQNQAINDAPARTKTFMERAIENATQLISGGLGGYVVLHSSSGGKQPDEILVMDTDDIHTATKVWRWNKAGLGYSSKGYNGPYATAMTQDGKIVADFITTGTMSANRINGGTLILGGKDNADGTCLIKDSKGNTLVTLDKNGITLSDSVMISFENIDGAPSIPTKTSQLENDSGFKTQAQVVQITKDTVTAPFIEALGVTANHVICKEGAEVAIMDAGRTTYYNGTERIGSIGTSVDADGDVGLSIVLDQRADFISFGLPGSPEFRYSYREKEGRKANTFLIRGDLFVDGFTRTYWDDGTGVMTYGITGEFPFVQIMGMNDDGTPSYWYNNCYLRFKNGILVDIRMAKQ